MMIMAAFVILLVVGAVVAKMAKGGAIDKAMGGPLSQMLAGTGAGPSAATIAASI